MFIIIAYCLIIIIIKIGVLIFYTYVRGQTPDYRSYILISNLKKTLKLKNNINLIFIQSYLKANIPQQFYGNMTEHDKTHLKENKS